MSDGYQPRHARIEREGAVLRVDGVVVCDAHQPVQHRAARPPWCKTCRLTEAGARPIGRYRARG